MTPRKSFFFCLSIFIHFWISVYRNNKISVPQNFSKFKVLYKFGKIETLLLYGQKKFDIIKCAAKILNFFHCVMGPRGRHLSRIYLIIDFMRHYEALWDIWDIIRYYETIITQVSAPRMGQKRLRTTVLIKFLSNVVFF